MTKIKIDMKARTLLNPKMIISANSRLNGFVFRENRRYLRQHVGRVILGSQLVPVPDDRKVWLVYEFGFLARRKRDMENLAPTAKAITDGLRDHGILTDDDQAHVYPPVLLDGGLTLDTRPKPFTCVSLQLTITDRWEPGDRP